MNDPTIQKKHTGTAAKKSRILNNKYYLGQDILGQGAFGRVYKAIEIQPGRTVAIKELRLKGGEIQEDQQNEINLLKQIKHTNIMRYYDHFIEGQFLYIVSEYLEGGSLQDNYKQYGLISEEYYSHIMTQVLLGLIELHTNSILHRDLKAANLLQDKQGVIKITDLGIATKLDNHAVLKEIAGTPFWMAREVLLNQQCNEKSDIWSLGATLYELLSGAPPYFSYTPMAAMYEIATCTEVENVPTVYPDAYDFMQQCFIFEVDKRPSASQLLNHKFITKYQKNIQYIKQNLRNKSEEMSKKMKLLFWETKDVTFKKHTDEFSLFSDDSDDSNINFFDMLNKTGNQKQDRMIKVNIAKEQLKGFFEKRFSIAPQIRQFRDERNNAFARIFLEELEKKYSVQMFIEGLRYYKSLFDACLCETSQKERWEATYDEFLEFLKFLLYLIEESNQQFAYIQLLLQYNILEVFDIFAILSRGWSAGGLEKGLEKAQNKGNDQVKEISLDKATEKAQNKAPETSRTPDKKIDKNNDEPQDKGLSVQILKLLQLFSRYISIYPLLSSHGGLSIIMGCEYFAWTSNFELLESLVHFISVYTQQNHVQNDKIYENMFKEEYLGSLAQTLGVSQNLLKIIQRLMRYNCASKTFEQNEQHFIMQSDAFAEVLERHQERKKMILKLLYLLQDIYQFTSQQKLQELYEKQSGTIIEIIIVCLQMIQFIEQQKSVQEQQKNVQEQQDTVRHDTTDLTSISSSLIRYAKKNDKKSKNSDEENINILQNSKNQTCDLSNLLNSASETYNANDGQINSDLQSLITYSNFLIDAYQNIMFQHKRIGADKIDHNFIIMKQHLGSLLKISQSDHFRQKIQLLLYYIVQNSSDFLFQNIQNTMLYKLLLNDKASTFIKIVIIDALSKVKYVQITPEYIDCLKQNKVFDKMFDNFDSITIMSLYSKFYKLQMYCTMPAKDIKDVIVKEEGSVIPQSGINNINTKIKIQQYIQQKKQTTLLINIILKNLSNKQYQQKVKQIFQQNMNNEKICQYFETCLKHSSSLRSYIEKSSILQTIANQAFIEQNTVSRQLKIQMIYLIYVNSKSPRQLVRNLQLRDLLNDYMLSYEQNEQVMKMYFDIIEMQT